MFEVGNKPVVLLPICPVCINSPVPGVYDIPPAAASAFAVPVVSAALLGISPEAKP